MSLLPIGVAFIALGVLFIILDLRTINSHKIPHIRRMKSQTLAAITGVAKNTDRSDSGKKWTISYRCYIRNEEREFKYDTNQKYREGENMTIFYNPKNPEEQIPAPECPGHKPFCMIAAICCVIVGGTLVLIESLWPVRML